MTTTAVLVVAAAAGTLTGITAGAFLASWAWETASGETRRDPDHHRLGRSRP